MRKYACVKPSRHSFVQDGGRQKQNVPQLSFCDDCLYSEVAAGKASGKANTVPVVVNADHSKSIVSCSNIKWAICSEKSQPDIEDRKNVENADKVGSEKMKLFDINGLEDKYINSILIRSCHDSKNVANCNAKSYKLWKSQTDFEFIPLGEFRLSDSSEVNVISDYCPIKAHAIVKSFHKPNYLGARLKVDSQLNLEAWKAELHGYWDSQLIDLLYFGFPLDFNRNSPLRWEGENHKSTLNFPRDIEVYLEEELQYKAIVGPFEGHPCTGGHISPFLTREKRNSENRRVIVDLSWPLGESANRGIDKHSYLGTDFTLSLPTIDHITDQVKAIGRGCQLYKVDISRAFRHIKVDPLDYDLLGLSWRHIYVDTCVPFGSRHGSQILQRCSNAIRFIMRKNGHKIVDYVDDYIGFGMPAEASFQTLVDLLHRLGLTISDKKLHSSYLLRSKN